MNIALDGAGVDVVGAGLGSGFGAGVGAGAGFGAGVDGVVLFEDDEDGVFDLLSCFC